MEKLMTYTKRCWKCKGEGATRVDHYDPEVPCGECDGAGYIIRDEPADQVSEFDVPHSADDFPELILPESGQPVRVKIVQSDPRGRAVRVYLDEGDDNG